MLKYVETFQNSPHYLAGDATGYSRPLSSAFQHDFRGSSFVAVGAPWRFVSILISSALAYTDSEMELTRTCCFEFDRMLRADSKRVLLSTFCFYFRVAGFTHLSPLPPTMFIPEIEIFFKPFSLCFFFVQSYLTKYD